MRPTAADWLSALTLAESELQQCEANPQHQYPGNLTDGCPWCEIGRRQGRDSFPPLKKGRSEAAKPEAGEPEVKQEPPAAEVGEGAFVSAPSAWAAEQKRREDVREEGSGRCEGSETSTLPPTILGEGWRGAGSLVLLLGIIIAVVIFRSSPKKLLQPEAEASLPPASRTHPLPADPLTLDLGDGVRLKLVRIKKGSFLMGSRESDTEAFPNEKPQHEVEITKDFLLGKFAVTRGQFAQFVKEADYRTDGERDGKGGWGYNAEKNEVGQYPNHTWRNTGVNQTDEHPVVNVSWNDAQAFCKWLSKKTGRPVELPTEAEWEFACCAGTTTRYFTGDNPGSLKGYANVNDQTLRAKGIKRSEFWDYFDFADGHAFTSPVGCFKANPWGLYDMTGNVWQWCVDGGRKYTPDKCIDPIGTIDGDMRVQRGGSWFGPFQHFCRTAIRPEDVVSKRSDILGFRVAVRLD